MIGTAVLVMAIVGQAPKADAVAAVAELMASRNLLLEADRKSLAGKGEALDPARRACLEAELEGGTHRPSTRFLPLSEVEAGRKEAVGKELAASAKGWLELAGRAMAKGQYAIAHDCLRRVIVRDSDEPEARRLLGFLNDGQRWVTPQAARKLHEGQVIHPTYGWVPSGWVEHLDQGLLPAPSSGGPVEWILAVEADQLRQQDFSRAWQIDTTHFRIRANVPLAEGIGFGRRLEAFHQLFGAMMADVIGAERIQLAVLGRKPGLKPTLEPHAAHLVNYYANKEEYLHFLRPREGPTIEQSLGVYVPRDVARTRGDQPTSYFYDDVGGALASTATLYHEVSHQLLFELSGASKFERNVGQYWVFEGLGTYFETVEPRPDGTIDVGGPVGPRMAEARKRIVEGGEYVPIEQLVRMDRGRFNEETAIYLHYAQSMALTVYLMDGEGGRFRVPFLQYVADVYRGRLRDPAGRSLEDRVGVSYAELDRGLKEYLAAMPAEGAGRGGR